jgi:hypothetical protein
MKEMSDQERLDFIKQKINYKLLKNRMNGKNKFIDDLLWLIGKAEDGIGKGKK